MNWWTKLRALPMVWRHMDTLLASQALIGMACEQSRESARLMAAGIDALKFQQTEIRRMDRAAENDARMLLAYARWCQKKGCAPTSRDLEEMVR
jgi:hypothetical protein